MNQTNDYLYKLLVDPSLPLAAKTMVLKLYGIKENHLKTALSSDNKDLISAALSHSGLNKDLLQQHLTENDNPESVCLAFKTRPELFECQDLFDNYQKGFDWAQENPEKSQELLHAIHSHPKFGELNQELLDRIYDLGTSDMGKKLGLVKYFDLPNPEPNISEEQKDIVSNIVNKPKTIKDENGFTQPTTEYPNGSDSVKLL